MPTMLLFEEGSEPIVTEAENPTELLLSVGAHGTYGDDKFFTTLLCADSDRYGYPSEYEDAAICAYYPARTENRGYPLVLHAYADGWETKCFGPTVLALECNGYDYGDLPEEFVDDFFDQMNQYVSVEFFDLVFEWVFV